MLAVPVPGRHDDGRSVVDGRAGACRRGERFLSHICESLLHAARLPEWIADDDDAYVAKAVAVASDAAGLAALRAGRAQVLASPLCDAPRFARHFEDALHAMWAGHVEAESGASS